MTAKSRFRPDGFSDTVSRPGATWRPPPHQPRPSYRARNRLRWTVTVNVPQRYRTGLYCNVPYWTVL
eukprot:7133042-Pyramimonas_sp.AAC.1